MNRRGFLVALGIGVIAGPAIVRVAPIMQVRAAAVTDGEVFVRMIEEDIQRSLQAALYRSYAVYDVDWRNAVLGMSDAP